MSFEFNLETKRLPRRQRRGVHDAFTGVAGPYGEVTIIVTIVPQRAELTSDGLPPAWILHPAGTREGLVWIDDTTQLVVDEQEAKLAQNRRGLSKEDRALHIELGDRHYTYLSTGTNLEELREAQRGPLVRIRHGPYKRRAVTVLPETDELDLSLGLILQGASMDNLTLTRTVLTNVWYFFNNGQGEI
jgi:hypothetical protein